MTSDEQLTSIFSATFDVMHTYLLGQSRKNKACFLQYLHFFQHKFRATVTDQSSIK